MIASKHETSLLTCRARPTRPRAWRGQVGWGDKRRETGLRYARGAATGSRARRFVSTRGRRRALSCALVHARPLVRARPLALAIAVAGAAAAQRPAPAVAPGLHALDFAGVTIDDGLLRRCLDETREFYLRIPDDDLLRPFRVRKGLPAPGAVLGGWYANDVFHPFGQIVSGLARLGAATGDAA